MKYHKRLVVGLLLLASCGQPNISRPNNSTQTTLGLQKVLEASHKATDPLEIDVYGDLTMRRGQVANDTCPSPATHQVLTDTPVASNLVLLTSNFPNDLFVSRYPEEQPWLIAVSKELVPYHSRLKGHFGDDAYAHCPNARRIFVVDSVTAVYEEDSTSDEIEIPFRVPPPSINVPRNYENWPIVSDKDNDINLRYPAAAVVENSGNIITIHLTKHELVTFQVHNREVPYDRSNPDSGHEIFRGFPEPFTQNLILNSPTWTHGLHGYLVDREATGVEHSISAFFVGKGKTYELTLRYHVGFDMTQAPLTAYSMMVADFQAPDVHASDPTPTPGPARIPPESETIGSEAIKDLIKWTFGESVSITEIKRGTQEEAQRSAEACKGIKTLALGAWIAQVDAKTTQFVAIYDVISGELLCAANKEGIVVPPTPTPWTQPTQPLETASPPAYPTPTR